MTSAKAQLPDFAKILGEYRPNLEEFVAIYKKIHQNPELSRQEAETAALAAEHLRSLRYVVHERIGGHGVVGVLKNGSGRTIALRADMDALPMEEDTGLPYASKKIMKDSSGQDVPVAHACGHDMHVASLMAAATFFSAAKARWQGTLICIFQPSEELTDGARSMVQDGLWDKVPKPDVILGQHSSPLKAGIVALRSGATLASIDSFDVRVFGKGGHGSFPDRCVDPVVMACHIVVRLQSIVSREVNPGQMGLITCGSIHGGSAGNIIPDYVDLKITLRAYSPGVRDKLIAASKRVINSECESSGAPQKPRFSNEVSGPPLINDDTNTKFLKRGLEAYFKDDLTEMAQYPASEDFAVLANDIEVPYVYWMYGTLNVHKYGEVENAATLSQVAWNHSSKYEPDAEQGLRTAIDAFAVAGLTYLGK